MDVCTYILCACASCVCVQATEGATERDELRDLLGLETADQSRDSRDSREGGEPPPGTTHPMRDIHVWYSSRAIAMLFYAKSSVKGEGGGAVGWRALVKDAVCLHAGACARACTLTHSLSQLSRMHNVSWDQLCLCICASIGLCLIVNKWINYTHTHMQFGLGTLSVVC